MSEINPTNLPAPSDLPPENQPWTVYRDFMLSLKKADNFFERGKGQISWLQGECLNRAVASNKLKRGDYKKLLKEIGWTKSTGYNCRRIAQRFDFSEACRYGFTEMLRKLNWSTLDTRFKLQTDAPEFDDPEECKSKDTDKGQLIDPSPSRKRSRKHRSSSTKIKVDYENVDKHLDNLLAVAQGIEAMPRPAIELAEARKVYESLRRKLTKIIDVLGKAYDAADAESAKLKVAS